MTAALTLALLIAACTGFGAATLRGLGVLGDLATRERLTWAFAVGYGVLGWLLFFVGIGALYQPLPLMALLGLGALGLLALRQTPAPVSNDPEPSRWGLIDSALAAALVLALTFDLMEGLAPPADADSMAYHFALVKDFIAAGKLFFVERAMDGAVPLLNHMTYVPALALGGEKGLTLWTMASGWGATALLYSICRRYLDRRWSLALTVIFLTTPAVVYGGGSGQVEVRNAMFATIAAFSVARAVTLNDLRYAVLAGLGVGFFMAGKYLGLLFALACGLAILLQRRWFVHGLALTVVALAVGSQWYVWNFIHAGDPFFPMLFGVLDYSAVPFWNADQHAELQRILRDGEQAVQTNALWLVLYPFVATFSGFRQFESGRTGFGPYLLLMLPFALAGAWHFQQRLRRHPLLIVAVIAVLFYALWFLSGSSQRVRHMIPVLPLALLIFTVAAHRWGGTVGALRPLMGAVLVTVGVQLAGDAVFGLNYVRHFVSGESREAFLQRNVSSYGVVPWVNQNLNSDDRVYLVSRQLNYYLDVPYFYAHAQQGGWIDIRPQANDPLRFLRQIQGRGITHLLVGSDPLSTTPIGGQTQWRALVNAGCLDVIKKVETRSIGSRALGQTGSDYVYVLKVTNKKCAL